MEEQSAAGMQPAKPPTFRYHNHHHHQQQQQHIQHANGKAKSPNEQLQFLQSWTSRSSVQGLEPRRVEATATAAPLNATTATAAAVEEAAAPVLTARARTMQALAHGCKALSQCAGAKRLTYIPTSAWVNNTGDDYDDGRSRDSRTKESFGTWRRASASSSSPSGAPSFSSSSASTVERVFSLDERSMTSNSFASPATRDPPLASATPTVTSQPSASSPSRQHRLAAPPSFVSRASPAPSPPPLTYPPPAPQRTASVGNRRVLNRPSDVAALLHELLGSSPDPAPPSAAAPLKSKPTRGKAGKRQLGCCTAAAASAAEPRPDRVLDALAKIIVERINSGDHPKGRNKTRAEPVEPQELNSALLATRESNCNRQRSAVQQKSGKIFKAMKRQGSCRQQNCNNCYEAPVPPASTCLRRRHLCHNHSHLSSRALSGRSGHTAVSRRQWKYMYETRPELYQLKLSQPTRPAMPTCNWSNATNRHRPPTDLFFVRRDNLLAATWKSLGRERDETSGSNTAVSPVTAPGVCPRRRHRSLDCPSTTTDGSNKFQCFELVNTASGTWSTDTTLPQASVFLPNDPGARYPQFDSADCHASTERAATSVSRLKMQETAGVWPNHLQRQRVRQPQLNIPQEAAARAAPDAAAEAAAYAQRLFNSLLKSRDESGLVRPMNDRPGEVTIRSTRMETNPGGAGESRKLLHGSKVSIFVPESMLKDKCDETTLETSQCGQRNSHAPSVSVGNAGKCEYSQKPSVLANPALQKRPVRPAKLALHPPMHPEVELRTPENLPCFDCGTGDGAATTAYRKSRQTRGGRGSGQPDQPAVRRRGKILVVQPLADAIQQLIQLPAGIIDKLFSSWRPVKHVRPLLYIVPLSCAETTVPSQPADCGVTWTLSRGLLCHGAESVMLRFARRVASRIAGSLGIKCLFLDSPIDAAQLLNQSLLRTDLGCRGSSRLHFANMVVDYGLARRPLAHFRCPLDRCPCRAAHEDLELLRVTLNLAVQFRRDRRPGGDRHRPGQCLDRRTARTARTNCSGDMDAASAGEQSVTRLQQPKPDFLTCGLCEFESVAKDLTQLEAWNFPRVVVTHCPELVTNPNMVVVSVPSDGDDHAATDGNAPAFAMDRPTTDYRNREESLDMSERASALTGRMAGVTDGMACHLEEPLAADGWFLSDRRHQHHLHPQQSLCGYHGGQHRDGLRGARGNAPDDGWSDCQTHGASSCGSDQSQQRSYNSSSFHTRSSAVIPGGSEAGNKGVRLNITCELTVVKRAETSCSPEESLSSDSSEVVCA